MNEGHVFVTHTHTHAQKKKKIVISTFDVAQIVLPIHEMFD